MLLTVRRYETFSTITLQTDEDFRSLGRSAATWYIPLRTDFKHSLYVRNSSRCSAKPVEFRIEGNALNRKKNFPGDYALYAFDLTSDLREDDYFSLAKQKSLRFVVKFVGALDDWQCAYKQSYEESVN